MIGSGSSFCVYSSFFCSVPTIGSGSFLSWTDYELFCSVPTIGSGSFSSFDSSGWLDCSVPTIGWSSWLLFGGSFCYVPTIGLDLDSAGGSSESFYFCDDSSFFSFYIGFVDFSSEGCWGDSFESGVFSFCSSPSTFPFSSSGYFSSEVFSGSGSGSSFFTACSIFYSIVGYFSAFSG